MDHPKEGKTSDAQPQLRLRLDEVLPRRANPPRNPKKKEPHSPILDFDTELVPSYAQEEKNSSVSWRRLASAGARMGTPLDAAVALFLPSPCPISISCRRYLFHAIDSVGATDCTTALVSPPSPPPPPH
ncbi:hypothetical protein B0H14DRAFT_3487760 [Mycena olivaceomarginata]|nr:hypothetical protein B0H14DRAFT_3487760 [Mycena olivaceomarginata]